MLSKPDFLDKTAQAVAQRESGDLVASRKSFQDLFVEAEKLKQSSQKSARDLYIGFMGQWVIQQRLEGKKALTDALALAQKIYALDTANPVGLRGLSNTLMNLENYESAEWYLRQALLKIPSSNPVRLGDVQAHLARCLFRTGKLSQALALVEQALSNIAKGVDPTIEINPELVVSVAKTHALLVKALVLNSRGRTSESLLLCQSAKKIAKQYQLAFRLQEIRPFIEYLKNKADRE